MKHARDSQIVFAGLLCCVALVLVGCSGVRIVRLDETDYTAKYPHASIELFSGEVEQPYHAIAIIDSRAYGEKTSEIKTQQLEELEQAARRVGADAVHRVRLLHKKARGFVPDARVPFPAWKQGRYNLYFLRGEAIIYLPEQPPTSPSQSD